VAKTRIERERVTRSSVEVAKVGEELAREVSGFALNFATVAHGAVRAGLEDLFHAPVLADTVVDAGEAILGSQVEESGELVFNLGPRQFLDHSVVHDEEFLLFAVRGSGWAGDACERLGHHGGVSGLVVVVMVVVVRGVDAAEGVG